MGATMEIPKNRKCFAITVEPEILQSVDRLLRR